MSISELHPHHDPTGSPTGSPAGSPAVVLAEVVASLRELDATWWTSQSDDDPVAAVELV